MPEAVKKQASGTRITFSIPVDDEWIPVIRSRWYWRKHTSQDLKSFWPQRPVALLQQIPLWALERLPKDENGQVDLYRLLRDEYHGTVRLIVIAYDSWSDTKKVFIRRFDRDS